MAGKAGGQLGLLLDTLGDFSSAAQPLRLSQGGRGLLEHSMRASQPTASATTPAGEQGLSALRSHSSRGY